MAQVKIEELKLNFKKFCQITEFCIKLKISHLKKFYKDKAEEVFYKEIVERKEKNWEKRPS